MATLQQIADKLDVSVSLVSKVLSGRMGSTGARPEIAETIRRTAVELGYRRNVNAAALQSGRQQTLAILFHRHGQAGTGINEALLDGIATASHTSGIRQLLTFYDSLEEFSDLIGGLGRDSVDGIIVGGWRRPEIVEELLAVQQRKLPVVSVYSRPVSDAIVNVGCSDARMIQLAAEHLLETGARRILHIGSNKDREVGFVEAVRKHGIELDDRLLFFERGDRAYMAETGAAAVQLALDAGVDFDAICAQSDTQAVGAMHELLRRGYDLPREVRITGVDNSPFARTAYVPITSVCQRFRERGVEAVRLLSRMLDGRPVESTYLDPELIVRESSRV